jgi:hypothetical protein
MRALILILAGSFMIAPALAKDDVSIQSILAGVPDHGQIALSPRYIRFIPDSKEERLIQDFAKDDKGRPARLVELEKALSAMSKGKDVNKVFACIYTACHFPVPDAIGVLERYRRKLDGEKDLLQQHHDLAVAHIDSLLLEFKKDSPHD